MKEEDRKLKKEKKIKIEEDEERKLREEEEIRLKKDEDETLEKLNLIKIKKEKRIEEERKLIENAEQTYKNKLNNACFLRKFFYSVLKTIIIEICV